MGRVRIGVAGNVLGCWFVCISRIMRHTLTLVIVYGLSVALPLYPKTAVFFTKSGLVPVMVHLSKMLISFIPYITAPVFDDMFFLKQKFFTQPGVLMRYIGVLSLLLSLVVVNIRKHQKYAIQRKKINMLVIWCDQVGISFMWVIHRILPWLPILVIMAVPSALAYYVYTAPAIVGSMMRLILTWYSISIFCGIIFFILEIPLTPSLWVLLLLDIVISPMRNALATHSAMLLIALLHHPSDIHTQITHKEHV